MKPEVHVVVGILRRNGKILVAERPEGRPYSGYWEFPGGKIEAGESAKDALTRELHEELGVQVARADFWFSLTHEYPDKTVNLEMWLVPEFGGEPHGRENQTLLWATVDEITTLRLLEGNWPIIDKMRELL